MLRRPSHARRLTRAAVAAVTLVTLGTTRSAAADEADEILAKSLEGAKALYGKLPQPSDLGPDWKAPWTIPAPPPPKPADPDPAAPVTYVGGEVKLLTPRSEPEYWQEFTAKNPPVGLPEAFARSWVDDVSKNAASAGGGLTARDGVLSVLSLFRGSSATAAQKAEHAARVISRVALLETLAPRRLGNEGQAELDVLAEEYRGLDDAALKERFVKDATRIVRRTKLTYYRSNDWAKLLSLRSDKELTAAKVWVEVASITVAVVAEGREAELPDASEVGLATLQGKLQKAHAMLATAAKESQSESLTKEIGRLEGNRAFYAKRASDAAVSESERLQAGKTLEAVEADLASAKRRFSLLGTAPEVRATSVAVGDNAYTIHVKTVFPETEGLTLGQYTGWLRSGRMLVEIRLEGNAPEDVLRADMNTLLQKVHEKSELAQEI